MEIDNKLDTITISNDLDKDSEAEITVESDSVHTEHSIYIDREKAILIISHLNKVFNIIE